MSKNKNSRRKTPPQVPTTVEKKIPLVSVVMPVFNAAKFISQTLESLLYQTMTNFEVVAVDDCSTDNSIEVIESFRERFNGRLKLVKLSKNTGTPGLPRNVGIQLARGKYISFLDCDDLYTKTALEEMSTLAEKFQADVVHSNGAWILWNNEKKSEDDPAMTDFKELTNPKNFSFKTFRRSALPLPKEPVLETSAKLERLKRWLNWQYDWSTCTTFCKRDFLIANQIFFSAMKTSEDVSFGVECFFTAERYLSVPNLTYIIRPRVGSVSRDRQSISPEDDFRKRFRALVDGFKEFERIMDKITFFRERADCRYALFEWFANFRIPITLGFYAQNPAFRLNKLVKQKFHPDDAALASYLFNTVNVYRLHIMKLQRELAALKK